MVEWSCGGIGLWELCRVGAVEGSICGAAPGSRRWGGAGVLLHIFSTVSFADRPERGGAGVDVAGFGLGGDAVGMEYVIAAVESVSRYKGGVQVFESGDERGICASVEPNV